MISPEELLHGKTPEELTEEQRANLVILLKQVNIIREDWSQPMTVTSCVRTMAEHLAIYAKKGITDKNKIPMRSKHLYGQAVDISDPELLLTKWLKDNPDELEKANLWCEEGNKNWVHFQIVPFGSYKEGGTRWFLP